MTCKLMGDTRLDMGPGEMKRICAKSVNPGAKVGVAVGRGIGVLGRSVGKTRSVGAGVSVGIADAVMAWAVETMACPVSATTVGR